MNMTKEQKDYINNVILPTLVEMAIEDELPHDMNELGYHHFEKATEEYNSSESEIDNRKIKALGEYIGEDELSIEEQYQIIKSYKGDKNEAICNIEGLCPVDGCEYWTIQTLWDRLPA